MVLLAIPVSSYAGQGERIVNGTPSASGAWPAMAALVRSGQEPGVGQFCGGTLVTSRWILTAAHCVQNMVASDLYAYLGETDLNATGGEKIAVESILVHPGYNQITINSDLALVRLVSDSKQTPAVVIGQGDPREVAAAGKTGTAVGWGDISYGGTYPTDLLQTDLEIIPMVEARQDYEALDYAVTDNMLPAGVPGGGTGTCHGDSGGPFYVRGASALGYELAGVVSWGLGCAGANLPAVFVRLANYSDWVANATNSSLVPGVAVTHPVDGATEVPVNTALFIQFSADMRGSTVNASTVAVADGSGNAVPGTVRYDAHNRMALFHPSSDFIGAGRYTVTVSEAVADLNGVNQSSAHSFTFATAVGSDATPPKVVGFDPSSGAAGVSSQTSVSVVFDEYMDPLSINSTTLGIQGQDVGVTYEALSRTAVITPATLLKDQTDFTAFVSTEARDFCGNAMGGASRSTFTTAAWKYDLPPRMDYVLPNNGTTNRTVSTVVSAAFLESMDPSSFAPDTFILENAKGRVAGTVSYDPPNKAAVFTPVEKLDYAAIYTATLGSGVKTLAGVPLGSSVAWSFTTSSVDGSDANSTTSAEVASAKGAGSIKVSLSTAGARLYGVSAISDTDTSLNTSGKPSDYSFPDGLLAYQIAVPVTAGGASADVILTFPDVVNGTRVYKVDSSGFGRYAGAVVTNGNTVAMTVTDGGAGDADGMINGVINDPVGLASAGAPASSGGGGGGGCMVDGGSGKGVGAVSAVLLPLAVAFVRRAGRGRTRRA